MNQNNKIYHVLLKETIQAPGVRASGSTFSAKEGWKFTEHPTKIVMEKIGGVTVNVPLSNIKTWLSLEEDQIVPSDEKEPNDLTCETCGKEFSTNQGLSSHKRNKKCK